MRSFKLFALLAFIACSSRHDISNIPLESVSGDITQIKPRENKLTVIYFLSPECPLCINYTLALRNLDKQFSSDSLRFIGVFAKQWYSKQEVENFALKYDLTFETLFDNGNELAHALGATVTPEVFVLNSNSDVIYSGKIDNWVNELGKKKLEVSEHYLENALTAWQEGKTIKAKKTTPIGCLIE